MKKLHNKVDSKILKDQMINSSEERTTMSFYAYHHLPNPRFFRDHLYIMMDAIDVKGRIYVATEGLNAQISVPNDRLKNFSAAMEDIVFLRDIRKNYAIQDDGKSFFKLVIKTRNKIVADGLNDQEFDVTNKGIHLDARGFNELSARDDTIIVDMRNHYESEVGHFENAITPDVETFREALPLVEDLLSDKKDHPIIMYCTGGIRCEKASAYYKSKGFSQVYQLEGGIIEYTRQAKEQNLENKFIGKNFVFDERLGERISDDIISCCHQCGQPFDSHVNCKNDACHILFIQCDACKITYNDCCSETCREFISLPTEEQEILRSSTQFNGSKFGKGRYKANKGGNHLT